MQAPPETPDPRPWALLYRPHKKYARWTVIAAGLTYDQAVALIGCRPAGDWHLTDKPEHQPKPEEPTCRS